MSSNNLCHGLVLKIHSVEEIQILASFAINIKTVDGLDTNPGKNSCSLYKIEHSSTDLQPCLQMSSNSSCHGLVLKIHGVVEIQIKASIAIKKEKSRWTVIRNEKNSSDKIEHSSTDLQPCLQMSSNNLCHGLVLKIYSAVEIQI